MGKTRKLVWLDDGETKTAYGSGYEVLEGGRLISFHGEKGEILVSAESLVAIT